MIFVLRNFVFLTVIITADFKKRKWILENGNSKNDGVDQRGMHYKKRMRLQYENYSENKGFDKNETSNVKGGLHVEQVECKQVKDTEPKNVDVEPIHRVDTNIEIATTSDNLFATSGPLDLRTSNNDKKSSHTEVSNKNKESERLLEETEAIKPLDLRKLNRNKKTSQTDDGYNNITTVSACNQSFIVETQHLRNPNKDQNQTAQEIDNINMLMGNSLIGTNKEFERPQNRLYCISENPNVFSRKGQKTKLAINKELNSNVETYGCNCLRSKKNQCQLCQPKRMSNTCIDANIFTQHNPAFNKSLLITQNQIVFQDKITQGTESNFNKKEQKTSSQRKSNATNDEFNIIAEDEKDSYEKVHNNKQKEPFEEDKDELFFDNAISKNIVTKKTGDSVLTSQNCVNFEVPSVIENYDFKLFFDRIYNNYIFAIGEYVFLDNQQNNKEMIIYFSGFFVI